ncbi:baseplate J/gp47 family protein [Stenotrophomonas sp. B1-1]|uniref:baseplate assembly protein n=1 Tax=Stenotrophomonas sp. B1-1 TaxID=2710648 RepID=UPI0013DADA2E|nr:baseplate J/gp47 family protein [Stenotrophomonas sp. B1-1]
MSTFTAVDLSKLPVPDVFEQLSFEQLLAQRVAELHLYLPDVLLLESEPLYKLLQASAYRELILREQFNQRAKGLLLAYAQHGDLDHLAAPFGVTRQLLTPADPVTGAPAVYEDDAAFRRRIQLAPEGLSVAGPEGAYIFHALGADPRVLDASAISDAPGVVRVSILSREGDGSATAELIAAVDAALSADSVRPLTDHVIVQSVEVVAFAIDASVYTFAGPDAQVVLGEARRRLQAYVDGSHRIGRDVTRSGLFAALHAEGVQRVELHAPLADIAVTATQASHCSGITLTNGGVGDD